MRCIKALCECLAFTRFYYLMYMVTLPRRLSRGSQYWAKDILSQQLRLDFALAYRSQTAVVARMSALVRSTKANG